MQQNGIIVLVRTRIHKVMFILVNLRKETITGMELILSVQVVSYPGRSIQVSGLMGRGMALE